MAKKKKAETKKKTSTKKRQSILVYKGIKKGKLKLTNPRVPPSRLYLRIIGRPKNPLIVHEFSEKSSKQIESKILSKDLQEGQTQEQEAIVPEDEALYSIYWMDGMPNSWEDVGKTGQGLKAVHFKKAAASAAWAYKDRFKIKSKKEVLSSFQIIADQPVKKLLQLKLDKPPTIFPHWVRLKGGGATMRYRAIYETWEINPMIIEFDLRRKSPQDIFNWLCLAGDFGVGEWRAETGGDNGFFDVENLNAELQQFERVEVDSK